MAAVASDSWPRPVRRVASTIFFRNELKARFRGDASARVYPYE
jgi:hypothetical protein